MSKYGVISGLYIPVLSLNTGKYGPEITPYLDTFHAVMDISEYVIGFFHVVDSPPENTYVIFSLTRRFYIH